MCVIISIDLLALGFLFKNFCDLNELRIDILTGVANKRIINSNLTLLNKLNFLKLIYYNLLLGS